MNCSCTTLTFLPRMRGAVQGWGLGGAQGIAGRKPCSLLPPGWAGDARGAGLSQVWNPEVAGSWESGAQNPGFRVGSVDRLLA